MLNHKHIYKTIAFEVNHKHSAEWDKSIWRKILIWSWRFVVLWPNLVFTKEPRNAVWWY